MKPAAVAVSAILVALVFVTSSEAAPHLEAEYPVSGVPGRMVAEPDGDVWFTLGDSSEDKEFGRIDPNGVVTEYDTPNGEPVTALDVRALTDCADNNGDNGNGIWLTQSGSLVRWDPATATGTVVPAPALVDPRDISTSECGLFWVADRAAGLLSGSHHGLFMPFSTGLPDHSAESIGSRSVGGTVFWTDPEAHTLNRTYLVAEDGRPDEWYTETTPVEGTGPELSRGAHPSLDLIGAAGQLGFTSPGNAGGNAGTTGPSYASQIQNVNTPGLDPLGITPGRNGNYWIANRGSDDLSQFTPTGIVRTGVELPEGSEPSYLASGSTGDLWVGLAGTRSIARISGIDPAPTRPEVGSIRVSVESGRTIVRFLASEEGKVRIAIRPRSDGRVLRQVKEGVSAGPNEFDLGKALQAGLYEVSGTPFSWAPDWETRIEGWRSWKNFRVGGPLPRPKARVKVHGRKAVLMYRFLRNTAVRIVVHRRVGKRLRVESVTARRLPGGKWRRYPLGRYPKGSYVVRFSQSIRIGQGEVVTSRPTIIRFRIRR